MPPPDPGRADASTDRLRVRYSLHCDTGDEATRLARAIAYEQTVELPPGSFPRRIEESIVADVESVEPAGARSWDAILSFDTQAIGAEAPQLVNLLYGNVSMLRGVRVSSVDWPASLLSAFPGPRRGTEGLRKMCGAADVRRPLLCVALKPVGMSTKELAAQCRSFALAGVDLIKDDHGLANQRSAPFAERVIACQRAVDEANAHTGSGTLYFPHVGRPAPELGEALDLVQSAGCRGVLISPLLVGWDVTRWIAERGELAVLAHPSLTGAFFGETHGIAPEVLLGQVFRILGADGVIYPNAGGRFPWTVEDCRRLHRTLRAPLGNLRPSFPVPGGGIDTGRVTEWITTYGVETIFLIGGSLHAAKNPAEEARRLLDRLIAHAD